MKKLEILGNGQVWDIKGILPQSPELRFEDIFSGRALAQRAKKEPPFRKFIEKRKAESTGKAVTEMLLKGNKKEKTVAEGIIFGMGEDGARGIEAILRKKAKKDWEDWRYWSDIELFLIGGGVSEEKTGDILLEGMKNYLRKADFRGISILKAKFSGKEAGFLGAVAYIFEKIRPGEAVIGIDLGRENIGIGIILFDKRKNIVRKGNSPWIFRKQKNTPGPIGFEFRQKVVDRIASLIEEAVSFIHKNNLVYSRYIGLSTPGEVDREGNLIGSTDFMPYFQKKHGFYFKKELSKRVAQLGYRDFEFEILNDGIAAGLANLVFGVGLDKLKPGRKYAFLGVGSGLAGCLARVNCQDRVFKTRS